MFLRDPIAACLLACFFFFFLAKTHLDLRHTTRSGWDATELKLAQQVVVLGHGSLSLEHLDGDGGLLVLIGGEGLGLLGWDDSTSVDDLSHHTSNSLNT